jgi:hypothetical protein
MRFAMILNFNKFLLHLLETICPVKIDVNADSHVSEFFDHATLLSFSDSFVQAIPLSFLSAFSR